MSSETTSHMLARLVNGGGKILIVGGGVENLPHQYVNHPQLLFWDDNFQGHEHKEVPTNVRAIVWGRWISHSTVARLNKVVTARRLLKFPFLKPGQMKSLLADVVSGALKPPVTTSETRQEVPVSELQQEQPEKPRAKIGQVGDLIERHLDWGLDYTVLGTVTRETKRLMSIAEAEGIPTTMGSLMEGIRTRLKRKGIATVNRVPGALLKVPKPKKEKVIAPAHKPVTKGEDDFVTLDRLLEDAITALKLVQEHMPKVREETQRLRGVREKMMALLQHGGE